MNRWKKRWKRSVLLFFTAAFLYGCNVKDVLPSEKKGIKEYGKAESMVILTTEKSRYEKLYTDRIWSTAVDSDGTKFDDVLCGQVHDFMKELKLMSRMADEYEISLTSQEKDWVKEAAALYWSELGEDAEKALGVTQEEVEALYGDYCTAEKLVEVLTGDINLEISDSEAKVITISEIMFSDRKTAENALAKLQEENADFNTAAKEFTGSGAVQRQIHYGLMGDFYERAAFSLASGEISDVIAENGMYYILKCINDYDADATKIHKEEMMHQKKSEAFYMTYQTYEAENPLTEEKELWDEISVNSCPDTSADFFEAYRTVRSENEGGA